MWVSREQFPADFRQEEKEKSDFRKEDDKEKREGKVFEHARLFAHASRKKVIEGSCEEDFKDGFENPSSSKEFSLLNSFTLPISHSRPPLHASLSLGPHRPCDPFNAATLHFAAIGERGGGEDLRGGSGKDGRGIGVAETERGNGGNNCLSPRSRGARLCPMQGGSRKRWWWLYHREQ
ncbi:hypothetical protein JHK85_045363 [Glycine max]|nr:hypothetical protein JHK85_045363 [Glycine max]